MREPVLDRIQPKKLEGAGWTETRRRRAMAAARDRVGAGLALRHANELAVALVLLHGALRVQRTHARGHLVSGASPTMSPCGDGYGKQGGDGYGDRTGAWLGGK